MFAPSFMVGAFCVLYAIRNTVIKQNNIMFN
nr:MAG TPA: hypothetical protein [Caudoviricetes sp.]DAY76729.1 MAG TPA: hypothetical protein [Caudoviricetes sp.]